MRWAISMLKKCMLITGTIVVMIIANVILLMTVQRSPIRSFHAAQALQQKKVQEFPLTSSVMSLPSSKHISDKQNSSTEIRAVHSGAAKKVWIGGSAASYSRSLSMSLFFATLLSIFGELPIAAMNEVTYHLFFGCAHEQGVTNRYLMHASKLLMAIEFSGNFVIYSLFGRKFRQVLFSKLTHLCGTVLELGNLSSGSH